jgi:hypothetical protein
MATSTHIQSRGARRRALAIVAAFALLGVLIAAATAYLAPTAAARTGIADGAYGWPVKPFDQPHPVRGSFGDPRTLFHSPPTMRGLMSGHGSFSFHQGVDISAPNGAPVYPVLDGVVSHVAREWVRVDSGGGRAFEYWHVHAAVASGQRVTAGESVLGHIIKPAGHVHLTELLAGRPTNPLAPGHLTPYRDDTTPRVTGIAFRDASNAPLLPHFLRGRVTLLATAEDTPATPVPGLWNGLPVTPAVVSFEIRSITGKVVLTQQTAYDVRSRVPQPGAFWHTYARGTYQNMAVFGPHYSYLQRGNYLFNLAGAPFDTRRLRDGVYDVVVTAADIAGNSSSLSLRFTVHNRPGWVGS